MKAASYNEQCSIVGTGPQAITNLRSSIPVPLQECTGIQQWLYNVHDDVDDRGVFR